MDELVRYFTTTLGLSPESARKLAGQMLQAQSGSPGFGHNSRAIVEAGKSEARTRPSGSVEHVGTMMALGLIPGSTSLIETPESDAATPSAQPISAAQAGPSPGGEIYMHNMRGSQ